MRCLSLRITVAAAFLVGLTTVVNGQQTLTAEEIINSLQAKAPSEPSQLSADEILQQVKNRIEVIPREGTNASDQGQVGPDLNPIIANLPSISMEVYFDYNSATLNARSIPTLITLGKALEDSRLSSSRFLIAGHTNAVGSQEHGI